MSLIHAGALGFLGGITASIAAYGWEHGPTSTIPGTAFFGVSFFVGAACYAALVAALQLARVRRSKMRTREGVTKPITPRLESLDFSLQLKLMALVWVPVILCNIVGGMTSNALPR